MSLSKELQDWYNNQFDLFGTEGFKAITEQAGRMAEQYDTLSNLKTQEDLFFRQGQLDILRWFLNWESSVNTTFKDLNDDDPSAL